MTLNHSYMRLIVKQDRQMRGIGST